MPGIFTFAPLHEIDDKVWLANHSLGSVELYVVTDIRFSARSPEYILYSLRPVGVHGTSREAAETRIHTTVHSATTSLMCGLEDV